MRSLFLFIFLNHFFILNLTAQSNSFEFQNQKGLEKISEFKNASFEKGLYHYTDNIVDWQDCGLIKYTPPTLHENGKEMFGVTKEAYDGERFISMVARENESWEMISQEADTILRKGEKYIFALYACLSKNLKSAVMNSNSGIEKFDEALILRVYGGEIACDKSELLFKSEAIKKQSWQEVLIEFEPSEDLKWITIECFFDIPIFKPYNGNILVDHLSPIYRKK